MTDDLTPGWLLAVVPDGVAAVGPDRVIEVVCEGDVARRSAALNALCSGDAAAAASLLGASPAQGAELFRLLEPAFVGRGRDEAPAPPEGLGLACAVRRTRAGELLEAQLIWTAEEVLVLPAGLDQRTGRRALRAFVAGLAPDPRLFAYCLLVGEGADVVRGDLPDAALLSDRLAQEALDPALIAVIGLRSGARATVDPSELERLGADRAHRLGPLLALGAAAPLGLTATDDTWVSVAEHAVPNLRFPFAAHTRATKGAGQRHVAGLVARAEAAERFAAGDVRGGHVRRARAQELPGVVPPTALYAANQRQLAELGHPPAAASDADALWCAARAPDGSERWVPAEAVYSPFIEPGHEISSVAATASGVAAHTDADQARRRAFYELIERDAFMWTWTQRVSRERISDRGLPEGILRRRDAMLARGWEVCWVNLTLDTLPVILCAAHGARGLVLGAACDPDPGVALRHASDEAFVLAVTSEPLANRPIAPEDVRTPHDHLRLHADPARRAENGFLFSSDAEVALADVDSGGRSGEDVTAALRRIGVEALTVDLTTAASSPFAVIRALAPGLVPITFGWDVEPLGMRRLAQPLRCQDGRLLGIPSDLAQAGPLFPHAFS